MRYSFHVPSERITEVKAIIRNFPSLRFEGNPLVFGTKTHIALTGEVREMNAMQVQLDALLDPEPPELKVKPPTILTKIVTLAKKLFSNPQP